jgi:hypothetical protein
MKRALIVGAFSDVNKACTFGDLQAAEVLGFWLTEKNIEFDVVNLVSKNNKNIGIDQVKPEIYHILIYVCGPFGINSFLPLDIKKFSHCKKISIDTSIVRDDVNMYGGRVDYLLPRDSKTVSNPDIVFNIQNKKVPVIGVFLVHEQGPEKLRCHGKVQKAIWHFFNKEKYARLDLDTLITAGKHKNKTRVLSVDILESFICKCDAVISTRLHGVVYSLKNKIPVLAIDPIIGGHKVQKQAESISWPAFLRGEDITGETISLEMKKILEQKYAKNIESSLIIAEAKCKEIKNQLYFILDN